MVKGRCLGRLPFLAPLANFADFGDQSVFRFRGRVGESVPQNGFGVEVSIGVQHFAVAKRLLVEGPPNKVGTGVGTGPVPCGLSCRDHGGGSGCRGGDLESGGKLRWCRGRVLSGGVSSEKLVKGADT